MKAAPLGLRLFMEGIEVPAISAQINIAPSQPVTSAIQIIPTDTATEMLPRTLVHLFALDNTLSEQDLTFFKQLENNQIQDRNVLNRIEAADESYKLIFGGEVIGYQYVRGANERQLVLQCMDWSIYWDTCYQWYADYSVGGDALTDRSQNFVGAGSGLFDNIAGGHKWVISQLLNSRPKSQEYSQTKGLLGGLIHLLEAVGGVRPVSGRGYSGVNELFTLAELRYNILGMLGAVEEDKTSTRIYAAKAFRDWIRSGMSSMGNLISFRDILRHVGRYIFHDIYPNPAPYLAPPRSKRVSTTTAIFSDTAAGKIVIKNLGDAYDNLEAAYTMNEKVNLDDPGETFKGVERQLNFASIAVDVANENLRSVRTSDVSRVKSKIEEAKGYIDAAIGAIPASPVSEILTSAAAINEKIGGAKTSNGYEGGAIKAINDISNEVSSGRNRRRVSTSVEVGTHMYNQLVLPETFFVAPPRCNVLFPDQIYNFSYSRNFMREVTRLSCHSGLGFIAGGRGSKLLARKYFAPSIRDTQGKTLYATMNYGHRVILPHETHSGIVPKFEWVTSGHRWATKAAKERGREDQFFQAGKVGYIQRLAHFQFYLHRWASRTMSAQTYFNPNMVIGFPGLIIDKPVLPTEVRKPMEIELGRELRPTQFIGKVHSLVHNLSQSGGLTSVNYTHCRTHRGVDDEFLGVLTREKVGKRRRKIVMYPVEMSRNLRAGGNRRKQLENLLLMYLTDSLNTGIKIRVGKISGKVSSVEASQSTTRVSRISAKNIGVSSEEFDGISTDPDKNYISVPDSLTVTVEYFIGTGEFVRSNIAIEDALMPGWYSDVWWKENISEKVYLPLLGTRAITDDESLYEDNLADQVNTEGYDSSIRSNYDKTKNIYAGVNEQEVQTDDGTTVTVLDVDVDTLEKAIDGLAAVYSIYKERDLDVHEFIQQFTTRPIANLVEVLGSQNLEFSGGEVADTETMVEGFHSRAFGDYNTNVRLADDGRMVAGDNALGDLPEGTLKPIIPRGRRQENVEIPQHLDPRGRSRARVLNYVRELEVSRGLLGT